MNKRRKEISILVIMIMIIVVMAFPAVGCSKPADAAGGEYLFQWEKVPLGERTGLDYKYILDGHGGGEYHHKGSVHKIKYTYENGGKINISDTMTGIKYNGTLINGELHIYDGNPNSINVSEFMYVKSK